MRLGRKPEVEAPAAHLVVQGRWISLQLNSILEQRHAYPRAEAHTRATHPVGFTSSIVLCISKR